MYTSNNFYPQGQYTSSQIPQQGYVNQMGMYPQPMMSQTMYTQPMYTQPLITQPVVTQPIVVQQPVAVPVGPVGDPYCLNCHGTGYRNGKRCMCIGGTSGLKTAIGVGIAAGVVNSLLGPRHPPHHHPHRRGFPF